MKSYVNTIHHHHNQELPAVASENESSAIQPGSLFIDTVRAADVAPKALVAAATDGSRPVLDPPKASPQEALAEIARAFIAASDVMDESVSKQILDYTQSAQLYQTQTQIVFDTAAIASQKQEQAAKDAAEATQYQQKMAKEAAIFGWIALAVGILVIVGTAASTFFTGGATAPLLEEEIEMVPLAVEGIEGGAEASVEAVEAGVSEATTTASTTTSTAGETAATTTAQTIAKKAFTIFISMVLTSPTLAQGIGNLKVAPMLSKLAQAQKSLGDITSLLEKNRMYGDFLQKYVNKEGDIFRSGLDSATGITSTYSTVMHAYKGIANGLANSV